MTSTHASLHTGPSLRAMARIETIRLAKNPFFIIGNLIAAGLMINLSFNSERDTPSDLMTWPVMPAFFIGLTSLVVMARQTRSTEAAAEAMSAAPGTEARRTQALLLACLLPAATATVLTVFEVIMASVKGVAPQEWWFGTVNDVNVWAVLIGSSTVACFGGAVLGVLIGRWISFPGASAVAVIALVVITMVSQISLVQTDYPVLRLWAPWPMWQGGTETDGRAWLYGGSPVFNLVYLVCLCAAAAIGAILHDKTARTSRLRATLAVVVAVGLVSLALSMTVGDQDNHKSDPVPWLVE